MGLEAAIKITAEAHLEGVKQAEQALTRLASTTGQHSIALANLAAAETKAGVVGGEAAAGVGKVGTSLKGLAPAMSVVASQMGGMEAGAGTLSRGLSGLAMGGFTPVGVAIGVGLIGLGLYQDYMRDTKEATEKTAKAQKDLADAITSVKQRTLEIRAATDQQGKSPEEQIAIQRGEAIRQAEAELKKQINMEGVTGEDRKRLWRETEAQIYEIRRFFSVKGAQAAIDALNKRNDEERAIRKETLAIYDAQAAQGLQLAAIGKTGAALANVTLAQNLYALATSDIAQKDKAAAGAMAERAIAASKLQTALAALAAGQAALAGGSSQFGLALPGAEIKPQLQFAQNFAETIKAGLKTGASQEDLGNAFANFIQQAAAMGIKDMPGLLRASGLDSAMQQNLKVGLVRQTGFGEEGDITGQNLINQFERSADGVDLWGAKAEQAVEKYTKAAGDAGLATTALNEKFSALEERVAAGLALQIDTSPAEQAVQRLLDQIPERRTLILDVQFSGNALQQFRNLGVSTTGVEPDFGEVLP
jgi:hypothetical protein